jgi:hypothetical protein
MLERVVYIGGTARSGTTALGRGLAESAGCVWAGELVWLPRDMAEDRLCSCGEPAGACPFWREVRGVLGWSDTHLRDHIRAMDLERHRGLPAALRGGLADRRPLDAVASVADARLVVDTSKYAARALRLHRAHPRVDLLWVSRDPSTLAASLLRVRGEAKPFGVAGVVAYDAVVSRSWRAVQRRLPVWEVKVESLWAHPSRAWSGLARELDLPGLGLATTGWADAHALTAHREVAVASGWENPSTPVVGTRARVAAWGMAHLRQGGRS